MRQTLISAFPRLRVALVAISVMLSLGGVLCPQAALADAPRIVIDGSPVQLTPPAIEQSGRVFVPIRGVFQRLGASVVYHDAKIDANGNGRAVGLTIGSKDAVVQGQHVRLGTAPFTVNGSAYVPLRFVSEALGASVDYANQTHTVTIAKAGRSAKKNDWLLPAALAAAAAIVLASSHGKSSPPDVALVNLTPAQGAYVDTRRPYVSAQFNTPVDAGTVRIALDGRDVTYLANISSSAFGLRPDYDLSRAAHSLRISGTSQAGRGFDRSWSFFAQPAPSANFLRDLAPVNGARVTRQFTISGWTLPNSNIRLSVAGAGTYGLVAGPRGGFSQAVKISAVGLQRVNVTVLSTTSAPIANRTASAALQFVLIAAVPLPPASYRQNYVRQLNPPNGSVIREGFTLFGLTAPYSRVHISVTGGNEYDVVAGPRGGFNQPITVMSLGTRMVTVQIRSVAPWQGASAGASASLRYRLSDQMP